MPTAEPRIFELRGIKVVLDSELAALYGVSTSQLKRQVRRNRRRFPSDFLIELSPHEAAEVLRCQIGTLETGGYSKHGAFAFTEHGVAMLSSVLRSPRAIDVNIAIMRAFIRLRETSALGHAVAAKLKELETKVGRHDAEIADIFSTIRGLMEPVASPLKRIGFRGPRSAGPKGPPT